MKNIIILGFLFLVTLNSIGQKVSIEFTECKCASESGTGMMPKVNFSNSLKLFLMTNGEFEKLFKEKGFTVDYRNNWIIFYQQMAITGYNDCYNMFMKGSNSLKITWSLHGSKNNVYPFEDIESEFYRNNIEFSLEGTSKVYRLATNNNFGNKVNILVIISRENQGNSVFSDLEIRYNQ